MINVKELGRLEAAAEPAPWAPDGGGGLIHDEEYDAHLVDEVANGPFIAVLRNAAPAFLRVVNALHAWDCAMGDFQQEQAERERRGEVISMDWSLKRCGEVQDKLDEAIALLRLEFSFEDK